MYTCGLGQTTGSGTELILTGVHPDTAVQILAAVAGRLLNGTIILPRDYGTDLTGLLDGFPLRLRPVHSDWLTNFRSAHQYGQAHPLPGGTALSAAQILLPDPQGHFPGDPAGYTMDAGTPDLHLAWVPILSE